MKVSGKPYRTIWLDDDGWAVRIIDQTLLPHRFEVLRLESLADAERAIAEMQVRGAPLIGATAAYGVALAVRADPSSAMLDEACGRLRATRPTAVNLGWALERMRRVLGPLAHEARVARAYSEAQAICEEDVAVCARMGEHGLAVLDARWRALGEPERLNILTHCNAGWLATVDWGTALAPVYMAYDRGLPLHVYVDETRPRNQGASLTAWELLQHGVPHTVVVDNAGGHLMQHGMVDLCIVGTDRTTARGDVANKIGTYLKALAARDNDVPFYVALPSSSIDWQAEDGVREIPIEERSAREVTHIRGRDERGRVVTVQLTPPGSSALNFGFDVTPARLITGLITERGVCDASSEGLRSLFNRDGQP